MHPCRIADNHALGAGQAVDDRHGRVVAVRDRDQEARAVGGLERLAVQLDLGALGSGHNLDILERRARALAANAQRLEHRLGSAEAAAERRLGVRLRSAVLDLDIGEVARDKAVVVRREGRDLLAVDADASNVAHHLLQRLLLRGHLGRLGRHDHVLGRGERGHGRQRRLEAVAVAHLDRTRVELGRDVVGVAVAADDRSVQRLHHSVERPRSRATLGVTAQPLLRHHGHSVARRAAHAREQLLVDVRLVLVVGLGRRHVRRDDTDVVGREVEAGERALHAVGTANHTVARSRQRSAGTVGVRVGVGHNTLDGHAELDGRGGARADHRLDGTSRRHDEQVDPAGDRVDESLLQDVLLHVVVVAAVAEHLAERRHATHTRTDTAAHLARVDVLVQLVRVRDARVDERLRGADERPERRAVDLRDNVVRNAVALSSPARRDLTGNETVKGDGLGHKDARALLEHHEPAARRGVLPGIDLVAVLELVLGGLLGRDLERLEVVVELDLLLEALAVGVVVAEKLGLDEADAGVLDDVLLVVGADVLVIDGLATLGVDPADVGGARLELTVVVLDQAHDPGQLDHTLVGEVAKGLHLPTSARRTPRSDLGETGDDDDLLEVHLRVALGDLAVEVESADLGEAEGEVAARVDVHLLVQRLGGGALDDLEVGRVVSNKRALGGRGLLDGSAELAGLLGEVDDLVHATVEVDEERLDLADGGHGGGQETEQVERHLGSAEGAAAELLDLLGDRVGRRHEARATAPADDGTGNAEEHLRGPRVEVAAGLLGLDGTEQANEVGEHESVGELGLVVDAIDLSAVLRDGGEGHDKVEVEVERAVDVLDEVVDILLRGLVEGHHRQRRTTRTDLLVDALVVLDDAAAVAGRRDHDASTTGKETLDHLDTDGSLADTGSAVLSGRRIADLGSLRVGAEAAAASSLAGGRTSLARGAERTDHLAVQTLDGGLAELADRRLVADERPELGDVLLGLVQVDLAASAKQTATGGHLLDVGLELADTDALNFAVGDVAARVDLGVRSGGSVHLLVHGVLGAGLTAVLDELLAVFLGEGVGGALLGIDLVDVELHVAQQAGVGTVHERDATSSDLAVDRGEATVDNVVQQRHGVLTSPVPVRAEVTDLLLGELGHDAVGVHVAVLGSDGVELSLSSLELGLGALSQTATGAAVHVEVALEHLDLAADVVVLLRLELVELLAADRHTTRSSASAAGASLAQADASEASVGLGDRVEPSLGLSLGAETLGGLHGDGNEQNTVDAAGSKTPCLLQVRLDGREVEATGQLTADRTRDQARGGLAERTAVAGLESTAKLLERQLLAALGQVAEFGEQVRHELVAEHRLSADRVLDGLGERHLGDALLELLGQDGADGVDGLERLVGHVGGSGTTSSGRSRRSSSSRCRCSSRSSSGSRSLGGSSSLGRALVVGKRVVERLLVLARAEHDTLAALGKVDGRVLERLRTLGHAHEGRAGAKLDESLKVVVGEHDVLRLDPADGRGELVGEQLDHERGGEPLDALGRLPLVLLPVLEHLVETRRVGLGKDELGVRLGQLEGCRDQVGDVAANEQLRSDGIDVDALRQVRAEGRHTAGEVARVEGHVDTRQRDGGETALELDAALLLLLEGSRQHLADDLGELLAHLLDGHDLVELLEVDLLHLDKVEHVAERRQRNEVTGSDVLLASNVVVDDLKQTAGLLADRVDDLGERLTGKGGIAIADDAKGVAGHHGVVGGAGDGVALHAVLHRETTVEDDIAERLDLQNAGDSRKRGVLSERVTGEGGIGSDETALRHVAEGAELNEHKRDLSELGGEEQTLGRLEGVALARRGDLGEERQSDRVAVGVRRLVGHRHVALADRVTTHATKVDGLGERVLVDDLENAEAHGAAEVTVGLVPERLGGGTRIVQVHAHALLLRTLTGEDVHGGGLLDLSLAIDDLVAVLVEGLDLDDLVAVAHGDVAQLDVELVAGQNHADKVGLERQASVGVALGSDDLDKLARGGAREETVGLVGGGCDERGRHVRGAERVAGLERSDTAGRDTAVALDVLDDRVAVAGSVGSVLDLADLDEVVLEVANVGTAGDVDIRVRRAVLVPQQVLDLEVEAGARDQRLRGDPVEPILGQQHGGVGLGLDVEDELVLRRLEARVEVGEAAAEEEARHDRDDGHGRAVGVLAQNGAGDADRLASVRDPDAAGVGGGGADVASAERACIVNHLERVAEVNEAKQIGVAAGHESLHDRLPTGNDGKVHGSLALGEDLAAVFDDAAEAADGRLVERLDGALELLGRRKLGSGGHVGVEPELPVELLDAVVAAVHDLVDRGERLVGAVGEEEVQRDGLAKTLLKERHLDLSRLGRLGDLDGLEAVIVATVGAGSTEQSEADRLAVGGIGDLGRLEGTQPAGARGGKDLKPLLGVRNAAADLEGLDVVGHRHVDARTSGELGLLDGKRVARDVVGVGHLALVVVVVAGEHPGDELALDLAEHLAGGDVGLGAVAHSHGALEDDDLLGILANDSVELGDERHGLLAAALADGEEVADILSSQADLLGASVLGEEGVDEAGGLLVEHREALEERLLLASGLDAGEALLDTSAPVAKQLLERRVDPSALVRDEEELEHAARHLLVGHVGDVHEGGAVELGREPRLLEVLVETLDEPALLLREPDALLLTRQGEELVVELTPERSSTVVDVADALAELRVAGDGAAGALAVGVLPLVVATAGRVDEELLDSVGGGSLLGHQHPRGEEEGREGHGSVAELDRPLTGEVGPDTSASPKPEPPTRMRFFCLRRLAYVCRMGWWKSSVEWWPPARPPVHWQMILKSGLAAAMAATARRPSAVPGLKPTYSMPAALRPSMISLAFSVEGIPAATVKPLHGKPSRRIWPQSGYCQPNRRWSMKRPLSSRPVTRLELGEDLVDTLAEASLAVESTTGQLDDVAGVEDGGVDVGADGGRSHATDHQDASTGGAREGRVDLDAVLGPDQARRPDILPALLKVDLGGRVELGAAGVCAAGDDDANAAALEDTGGKAAMPERPPVQRDLALVGARVGADGAQAADETDESLGVAGDDEAAGSVEERDRDGLRLGQVRVGLLDVLLEDGLLEARDGKHGRRLALAAVDGVLDERRVDGQGGEELLTTLADVEEELERLGDVGVERLEAVRGRENNGRDDALRVAGGALDLRTELGGGEHVDAVRVVAAETLLDGILDELFEDGLRRLQQRLHQSLTSSDVSSKARASAFSGRLSVPDAGSCLSESLAEAIALRSLSFSFFFGIESAFAELHRVKNGQRLRRKKALGRGEIERHRK
ncbi:hypothetical protein L1887_48761 [Cichorium endivia]|nr:hypothetical protein L1887_48761 [Cichorium endivia]